MVHVRIGTDPGRPWAGCSPLANSALTRDALAFVERSLSQEHSGPVGSMIAVQDPESNTEVSAAIGTAKGSVLLGDSAATGLTGDPQRNDWKPYRFGPAPAQSSVLARDNLERAVWSAAGVPVELLRPSSGVDAREAWRRFLFAVVAPIGQIISGELRRLGLDAELGLDGAARVRLGVEIQELQAVDRGEGLRGGRAAHLRIRLIAEFPVGSPARVPGRESGPVRLHRVRSGGVTSFRQEGGLMKCSRCSGHLVTPRDLDTGQCGRCRFWLLALAARDRNAVPDYKTRQANDA